MAMAQVASAFPGHVPTAAEEQRIVLHGVSWTTYVMLRDTHESRHLRMTYVQGALEIMSRSHRHAVESQLIKTWREEEGPWSRGRQLLRARS